MRKRMRKLEVKTNNKTLISSDPDNQTVTIKMGTPQKKKMKKVIVVLLLFACICPASAELIIIEADDFYMGTNIDSYFPGISFYGGAFTGDHNVYSVTSTHANGQLGENVLGHDQNWDSWPHSGILQLTFERNAKSVSVRVFESTEDTPYTFCTVRLYVYANDLLAENYIINPQPQFKTLSIVRQDYDIERAVIYVQYAPICLDHIEVLLAPNKTLTIQTEPNFIDTVDPNCGEHICHLNDVMDLSASDYTACPNTWKFDHWMGDVNDPCSPNTTIVMDSNEIVTACFVPTAECNDICHPVLPYDFNADCYVDFEDFSEFANNWLFCNHPDCD